MYEPVSRPKGTDENVSAILIKVPEVSLQTDLGCDSSLSQKPEELVERLHKRLRHVHLHDNDRTHHLSLPRAHKIHKMGRHVKSSEKVVWRNVYFRDIFKRE